MTDSASQGVWKKVKYLGRVIKSGIEISWTGANPQTEKQSIFLGKFQSVTILSRVLMPAVRMPFSMSLTIEVAAAATSAGVSHFGLASKREFFPECLGPLIQPPSMVAGLLVVKLPVIVFLGIAR